MYRDNNNPEKKKGEKHKKTKKNYKHFEYMYIWGSEKCNFVWLSSYLWLCSTNQMAKAGKGVDMDVKDSK